jgi:hypothetical protein
MDSRLNTWTSVKRWSLAAVLVMWVVGWILPTTGIVVGMALAAAGVTLPRRPAGLWWTIAAPALCGFAIVVTAGRVGW